MDVCTPTRHLYATSHGYTLREQEYLVRTGQLDGGLAAPAAWRDPQPTVRPAAQPVKSSAYLEQWQPQAPIVYAQYAPAFDPDRHPEPPAKPKAAKPVQPPPVQQVPPDDPADGELPPDMTPAAWLAQRHVVSVARKTVADPATVSYVPVEEKEEPQLVVTPAGFRYTAKFEYLEIKR